VEAIAHAQMPEDLNRALVDDVRARRMRRAVVAFHEQVLDAVTRKRQRQGQPGGPGTDD